MKNFSFWRVVVATAFAVIFGAPVYAQEQEQVQDAAVSLSKQRYDECLKLYQQGDYKSAIQLLEQAVDVAKSLLSENKQVYTDTLSLLAVCYYQMGDYDKSIAVNDICLSICDSEYSDYAAFLGNQALNYNAIGNFNKAIELTVAALDNLKKTARDRTNTYITNLGNLAGNYCAIGNYAKAIELDTQALELGKSILGEEHEEFAACLRNLARDFSLSGNLTRAIELQRQAIAIFKNTLYNQNCQ